MITKAEFYIERKFEESNPAWVIYQLHYSAFFGDYLYYCVDKKAKFKEAYESMKEIRKTEGKLNNLVEVKFKDKIKYLIESDADLVLVILKAE